MPAPARPAYRLFQSFWTGLDWLYPPTWGGCGKRGVRWCPVCQQNTRVLSPPVCNFCGESLAVGGLCHRCVMEPPPYTALRSWGIFAGPLRQALHRLKYARDVALGEALAQPLIELFLGLDWKVDLVVPVPLSQARRVERGYNQAALLARPLALASGLPYRPKMLQKTRETLSQVGLTKSGRRINVEGAFFAPASQVQGKRILVIDDVTTSGATVEACAQALAAGGAERVYGLTLARAVQGVRP